jgi:alkanesulfonate monooxygenase SsuD/methylene tetrahydromethanopterin reductase-like flavin-dependent oxidoreductase (luciferase family)
MTTARGIGLAVTAPRETIESACRQAEASGYHSFWLNNPPRTDALAVLGRLAPSAGIWLGVGVIPLANVPPESIAASAREHFLGLERLYLGLGSGAGGIHGVEAGLRVLRSQLDGSLVVAALGPKMSRLAGAEADGVLFNWLTPEHAQRSIDWLREGAEAAERPLPRTMAYVRVALGTEAADRLRIEAGRYEEIPHYAAHFRRMGVPAIDTAVAGQTPEEVQQGLAAWEDVVDEVVCRLITANDTADEVAAVVEAARPAGAT